MCKVLLNEKLNGVELYFENKPAQEIINILKENKFPVHKINNDLEKKRINRYIIKGQK